MTVKNFSLRADERQKSHVTSALECQSHHALVFWASASSVVRQNLGVRGHKAAQGLRVFVVYCADFVSTEVADFFDRLRVAVLVIRSHKLIRSKVKG